MAQPRPLNSLEKLLEELKKGPLNNNPNDLAQNHRRILIGVADYALNLGDNLPAMGFGVGRPRKPKIPDFLVGEHFQMCYERITENEDFDFQRWSQTYLYNWVAHIMPIPDNDFIEKLKEFNCDGNMIPEMALNMNEVSKFFNLNPENKENLHSHAVRLINKYKLYKYVKQLDQYNNALPDPLELGSPSGNLWKLHETSYHSRMPRVRIGRGAHNPRGGLVMAIRAREGRARIPRPASPPEQPPGNEQLAERPPRGYTGPPMLDEGPNHPRLYTLPNNNVNFQCWSHDQVIIWSKKVFPGAAGTQTIQKIQNTGIAGDILAEVASDPAMVESMRLEEPQSSTLRFHAAKLINVYNIKRHNMKIRRAGEWNQQREHEILVRNNQLEIERENLEEQEQIHREAQERAAPAERQDGPAFEPDLAFEPDPALEGPEAIENLVNGIERDFNNLFMDGPPLDAEGRNHRRMRAIIAQRNLEREARRLRNGPVVDRMARLHAQLENIARGGLPAAFDPEDLENARAIMLDRAEDEHEMHEIRLIFNNVPPPPPLPEHIRIRAEEQMIRNREARNIGIFRDVPPIGDILRAHDLERHRREAERIREARDRMVAEMEAEAPGQLDDEDIELIIDAAPRNHELDEDSDSDEDDEEVEVAHAVLQLAQEEVRDEQPMPDEPDQQAGVPAPVAAEGPAPEAAPAPAVAGQAPVPVADDVDEEDEEVPVRPPRYNEGPHAQFVDWLHRVAPDGEHDAPDFQEMLQRVREDLTEGIAIYEIVTNDRMMGYFRMSEDLYIHIAWHGARLVNDLATRNYEALPREPRPADRAPWEILREEEMNPFEPAAPNDDDDDWMAQFHPPERI
ncbi:Protein CBG22388 [Caenorhabditis briggsae]|uniref:Protein CBG22388 n=1 Tax=Caenorhabditis briggsae TaxID=6238 RepID=A8Y247_CAEBR|nr:Protein CBG22388 [Caenorhabditis briggsae]CAP38987.2 Protein CBG22388 [Caenorhabditis briggsae]